MPITIMPKWFHMLNQSNSLKLCSPLAQVLCFRLYYLMENSTKRGYANIDVRSITKSNISDFKLAIGVNGDSLESSLSELIESGLILEDDEKLYSQMIVADEKKKEARKKVQKQEPLKTIEKGPEIVPKKVPSKSQVNRKEEKVGSPPNDIYSNPPLPQKKEKTNLVSGPMKIDNPRKEDVENWWNNLARKSGIPKINKITVNRWRKVKLRLDEGFWDKISDLEDNISNSNFLRGENRDSWKITFDWIFFNDINWLKVLENTYKNKQKKELWG